MHEAPSTRVCAHSPFTAFATSPRNARTVMMENMSEIVSINWRLRMAPIAVMSEVRRTSPVISE